MFILLVYYNPLLCSLENLHCEVFSHWLSLSFYTAPSATKSYS